MEDKKDTLSEISDDISKYLDKEQLNTLSIVSTGTFFRGLYNSKYKRFIPWDNEEKEFYDAIKGDNIERARFLIRMGVDVNARPLLSDMVFDILPYSENKERRASFIYLATRNSFERMANIEMVKLLIDNKADVNSINEYGNVPILNVLTYGTVEMTKLLIDNGADVGLITGVNILSLMVEPEKNNVNTNNIAKAELMIEMGEDVNVNIHPGSYSPIGGSVQWANMEMVQYFLSKGADINDSGLEYIYPLIMSVEESEYSANNEMAKFLIVNRKIDLNLTDKYIRTALHWAVIYYNIEITKLLIWAGADVNIQDEYGETAYQIAVRIGNPEIIELFEKYVSI